MQPPLKSRYIPLCGSIFSFNFFFSFFLCVVTCLMFVPRSVSQSFYLCYTLLIMLWLLSLPSNHCGGSTIPFLTSLHSILMFFFNVRDKQIKWNKIKNVPYLMMFEHWMKCTFIMLTLCKLWKIWLRQIWGFVIFRVLNGIYLSLRLVWTNIVHSLSILFLCFGLKENPIHKSMNLKLFSV